MPPYRTVLILGPESGLNMETAKQSQSGSCSANPANMFLPSASSKRRPTTAAPKHLRNQKSSKCAGEGKKPQQAKVRNGLTALFRDCTAFRSQKKARKSGPRNSEYPPNAKRFGTRKIITKWGRKADKVRNATVQPKNCV